MEEFIDAFLSLDFLKSETHLLVYNNQPYSQGLFSEFQNDYSKQFKSVYFMNMEPGVTENFARTLSMYVFFFVFEINRIFSDLAKKKDAEFLFMLDANAHLASNTIGNMIQKAVDNDM